MMLFYGIGTRSQSTTVGLRFHHAVIIANKKRSNAKRFPIIDTEYVYTYYVLMNVTLSIDEQTITRARKKAEALGTSVNQLIRDYLQKLAGGDDSEKSIEEFKRLSGQGNSHGWKFNRDEIHKR